MKSSGVALTRRVAAVLRAELERRGLTTQDTAARLAWSLEEAEQFLAGDKPLLIVDLVVLAEWLDLPLTRFFDIESSGELDANSGRACAAPILTGADRLGEVTS